MASDRRGRRIERLLDQAEEAVSRIDLQEVRDRPQAVLAFERDNGDALDLLTGPQRASDGQPLKSQGFLMALKGTGKAQSWTSGFRHCWAGAPAQWKFTVI